MRGEFIAVWEDTKREIWGELAEYETIPRDLFCELYRELASSLVKPPTVEELADIIDNPEQSRIAFESTGSDLLRGERSVVAFIEAAYVSLDDLGGASLSRFYVGLVTRFIEKFSLRYAVGIPFVLSPTLPGLFSALIRDLRSLSMGNTHLEGIIEDFDASVRDLRADRSEGRIKTCMQKQINLLEALAGSSPGVTGTELGAMCKQLNLWPHAAISKSLSSLYGFTSDYPGIRHAGNPTGAIRNIDLRDLLALSIVLAGFTPYLVHALDAESIYRGR